jgi:hypothetical protein
MGVEIPFPVEFVVAGSAVSSQARRRRPIREWQGRIREASSAALPEGHFTAGGPMAVTLYYFPHIPMQGDIDNIVKPILDALSRHIYLDDHQVERLLVQKFEPNSSFAFPSPSVVLRDALARPRPTLYVRLSDDPFEDFQ